MITITNMRIIIMMIITIMRICNNKNMTNYYTCNGHNNHIDDANRNIPTTSQHAPNSPPNPRLVRRNARCAWHHNDHNNKHGNKKNNDSHKKILFNTPLAAGVRGGRTKKSNAREKTRAGLPIRGASRREIN